MAEFSQPKGHMEEMLFKYRDPQNKGFIGGKGIDDFFRDLNCDAADPITLLIAWRFDAAEMGFFSVAEFERGMSRMGCDTVGRLSKKLTSLRGTMKSMDHLRTFYRWLYHYVKPRDQKSLQARIAAIVLRTVLLRQGDAMPAEVSQHVSQGIIGPFCQFLSTPKANSYSVVSEDQWNQLFEFCVEYDDDLKHVVDMRLKDFDEAESSWPSIIDEFVEWKRHTDSIPAPEPVSPMRMRFNRQISLEHDGPMRGFGKQYGEQVLLNARPLDEVEEQRKMAASPGGEALVRAARRSGRDAGLAERIEHTAQKFFYSERGDRRFAQRHPELCERIAVGMVDATNQQALELAIKGVGATVLTSAVEAAVLVTLDTFSELRKIPGAAATLSHKLGPVVSSTFMQMQTDRSESGPGYSIDLAAVAAARKPASGTADAASNPVLDNVLTKEVRETVSTALNMLDIASDANGDVAKDLLAQVVGAVEYANMLLAAHDKTAALRITKSIERAIQETDAFWLADHANVQEDIMRRCAGVLGAVDPKYEDANIGTAATIANSVTTLVKFQLEPGASPY